MKAIYVLRFKGLDKYYIGSTGDVEQRYRHHLSVIRRGLHRNRLVEAAYLKYGMPILEIWSLFVHDSMEDIRRVEKALIFREDPEKLLNIRQGILPDKPVRKMTHYWEIITEEGEVLEVYNLSEFCRQRKLREDKLRYIGTNYGNSRFQTYLGYSCQRYRLD